MNAAQMTMSTEDRLSDFLNEVDARCLWRNGKGELDVAAYTVQGKVFLVQRFPNAGWEIFIPASNSLKISETLESVRKFLSA